MHIVHAVYHGIRKAFSEVRVVGAVEHIKHAHERCGRMHSEVSFQCDHDMEPLIESGTFTSYMTNNNPTVVSWYEWAPYWTLRRSPVDWSALFVLHTRPRSGLVWDSLWRQTTTEKGTTTDGNTPPRS